MKKLIKKYYYLNKETINNFIWRSIQIFGKQGITFLIFILCAKLLSPYEFGIYNYILAIIFFLIIFGDFGISTATSKYVAEYNVTDKKKLKAVLFNSGIIILGLTILITVLTLILGHWYLQDKYQYVLRLLPLIFLAPMTSLYDGIYRGLKRFKQLAIISLVVGFVSLFFVYFLIKQYGLMGALWAQVLFYIILFIGLAINYKNFDFNLNKTIIGQITRYGFIYGIAILGNYLFIRFGILILGHYNFLNEIAIFELLNKIFMILVLPFTLLGQVVAPNFTKYFAQKKYTLVYNKLTQYTLYFFFIGIIIGTLSYLLTPSIIKLFFIRYYDDSFLKILPLAIIILITNIWATTVDSGILVATGHADIMAKFYTLLGALGLIMALVLLKIYGYIGVIWAMAISNIIMVIGLRIIYFYKIKKIISEE